MALYTGQHQWIETDPAQCIDLLSNTDMFGAWARGLPAESVHSQLLYHKITLCSHILVSPFHPGSSGFVGQPCTDLRKTQPALWGVGDAWWLSVQILQHDADGTTLESASWRSRLSFCPSGIVLKKAPEWAIPKLMLSKRCIQHGVDKAPYCLKTWIASVSVLGAVFLIWKLSSIPSMIHKYG